MNCIDICFAIQALRPGAQFVLHGAELSGLVWQDEAQTRPSDDEIMAYVNSSSYRSLRAAEYPPIGDQLDALWKGGQATADMALRIQSVKVKYPK